jgi:hypothetical protein
MSKTVAWMPRLAEVLNWGCANSRVLKGLKEENALEAAREICLDLWPFVQELPDNIAYVKSILPDQMAPAKKLFAQLADEERFYQELFLKQCDLAGVARQTLSNYVQSAAAARVKAVLATESRRTNYEEAVVVVAAAQLAATAFCRTAIPLYEDYFVKHESEYKVEDIEKGMEWIRLHARPQTRNALLLIRTLGELTSAQSTEIPKEALIVLESVFDLWQCPPSDFFGTTDGEIKKSVRFVVA